MQMQRGQVLPHRSRLSVLRAEAGQTLRFGAGEVPLRRLMLPIAMQGLPDRIPSRRLMQALLEAWPILAARQHLPQRLLVQFQGLLEPLTREMHLREGLQAGCDIGVIGPEQRAAQPQAAPLHCLSPMEMAKTVVQ